MDISTLSLHHPSTCAGLLMACVVAIALIYIVVTRLPETLRLRGLWRSDNLEGFVQERAVIYKSGPDVYDDDFYASVYDALVYNDVKNEYEVGEIVNKTTPSQKSRILDIGSGTGHHVEMLRRRGMQVVGLDLAGAMIRQSKKQFPEASFKQGDAMDVTQFPAGTFTHIMCLYFTLYYFKDKQQFFNNCARWLMPGGYLMVHVVDEANFDPILPPGNPLLLLSPQRYAEKHITNTTVQFDKFRYDADFKLAKQSGETTQFIESFKDNQTGHVRKNEHIMYMENETTILHQVQRAGFQLHSKIDMLPCQYEYQYVYVFIKAT